MTPFHLWIAVTGHGLGHLTQTAPLVELLRQRLPNCRLTLQTLIPEAVAAQRIRPPFCLVFLELFVLHYQDFAPKIRNAVAAGDLNAAFLLCHNLKSASGMIGAVRLSGIAANLEARVNRGGAPQEVDALVAEIGEEIERLMARVERILAEYDPS